MRILLHTRFYPNLGGIETLAALLAREWHRWGEEVTVVSDVAGTAEDARRFAFPVVYRPGFGQWRRLMRWADVFVHMNVSLRAYWPRWLARRPFVAVHHGHYGLDGDGRRPWRERLKLLIAARARGNIAASRAVASAINLPCLVVPNAFDDTAFAPGDGAERDRELAFVGRLVSDKGADTLLEALVLLRARKLHPRLTIIGDGPERLPLQRQAEATGLNGQVEFAGAQSPEQIARTLQRHQILVVPSRWEEPFGIVALEGIACGCVVVGSSGGGLPEAIGPCGLSFPNGDAPALAEKLAWLLEEPSRLEPFRRSAARHLEPHRPAVVARRYLEVFRAAVGDGVQPPGCAEGTR